MEIEAVGTVGPAVGTVLDTFKMLKERIEHLDFCHKVVRDDDLALTYMETVNKFRDVFEADDVVNEKDKEVLLTQVLTYLNEQGKEANGELVYILFLYLVRLMEQKE